MAFGQDFLQGFVGANALRDYTHASKTFLTNGYEFTPRNKFLFHVYFNINLDIPSLRTVFSADAAKVGLMVKTVDLPQFQISVDTMNQYNRKRLVQNRIDYQPCKFTFHDDQGDLIRNMWYNYFSYYYTDPTYKYDSAENSVGTSGSSGLNPNGFSYATSDIYSQTRSQNDWGYIGDSYTNTSPNGINTGTPGSGKQPFFRDIRIYGMSQHSYAAYILINPLITSWVHDQYNYSEGSGIMQHSMDVRYETVKYYSGDIGGVRPDTFVQGFGDPAYYDTITSALARPGSQHTVLGQGGLIDAGLGIYNDLTRDGNINVLGAVQKSVNLWQTWKNQDLRPVVNQEAKDGIKAILRGITNNPSGTPVFPVPPRQP
jgi:hypothetical protein